jgi:prolyl-tRNA synthetase
MRLTRFLTKPSKEMPKDEDMISAKLLLQANFISKIASGSYAYLPLGKQVLDKVEVVIRDEFEKVGAQEILSRMVQPASLWQKSNRLEDFGPELIKFKNRFDQKYVLATTHEEAITSLVSDHLDSYRDLPLLINQIQTKYRDEPRPRGGLIRTREFIMQDAYSFDRDRKALDRTYEKVKEAYSNIFSRCGLKTLIVDSYVGAMGGYGGEEFMVVNSKGEDRLIICPGDDYQANVEVAEFKIKPDRSEEKKLEEIKTPKTKTIDELCDLISVKPNQTAKMVFFKTDDKLVALVVRGDLDISQAKLEQILKTNKIESASEEEIKIAGATPGYANPNNLKAEVLIDRTIENSKNLVIGANKEGYHLKNYNYPRDFEGKAKVVDIAEARAGLACPVCGRELNQERGIEVGHIFKLGKKYSKSFDLKYLDENSKEQIPEMGCYGIGLGRLISASVEFNHDENGIVWPDEIAPYSYYLLTIGSSKKVIEFADRAYEKLSKSGKEVLYDDRDESPGVKFNDADLIGCPKILTISPKTVKEDKVEMKARISGKKELVEINKI